MLLKEFSLFWYPCVRSTTRYGVYVTYVADVHKRQWHVVTLVQSFQKLLHAPSKILMLALPTHSCSSPLTCSKWYMLTILKQSLCLKSVENTRLGSSFYTPAVQRFNSSHQVCNSLENSNLNKDNLVKTWDRMFWDKGQSTNKMLFGWPGKLSVLIFYRKPGDQTLSYLDTHLPRPTHALTGWYTLNCCHP